MKHLLLFSVLICSLTISFAQSPGDLDSTFDLNGTLVTMSPSNGGASSLLIQPDGKLVVSAAVISDDFSDFGLVRYFNNGTIDTSFGTYGFTTISLSVFNDFPYSISLFADGDILVAGCSYENAAGSELDFALARFNPDGSADTSFGDDGIVVTDLGQPNEFILSSVIQTDGKIVVAGSYGSIYTNFIILRYLSNGVLDTTFNGTGVRIIDLGPDTESATQVILQPDGKILVGGFSFNGTNRDFTIIRLDTNGDYDTGFGDSGISIINYMNEWNVMNAIALQTDGKIVCAGYTGDYPEYDFMIARLWPDGIIDSSFDDDGVVTTDIGSGNDIPKSVLIQPDGKIVAAGVYLPDEGYEYALTRYTQDGELDNSFQGDGMVTTNIPGMVSEQLNMAIWQPDGKITCAGGGLAGGTPAISMARYVGRLQENCDTIVHQPSDIDTIINADVLFTISSTGDDLSYQWQTNLGFGWTDLFDAGQYHGVTTDSLFVNNITIGNNNQYFRCMLISPDCTDTSDEAILTVTDDLLLQNMLQPVAFSVYPNPASGNITVTYTLNKDEFISLYLHDGQGRIRRTYAEYEFRAAGAYHEILSLPQNLSPGNYIIAITSPHNQVHIQVSVQ